MSDVHSKKMPDGITSKNTGVSSRETQNILNSLGPLLLGFSKSVSQLNKSIKKNIEEEKPEQRKLVLTGNKPRNRRIKWQH